MTNFQATLSRQGPFHGPEDKHTYVKPIFRLGADATPALGPKSLRFLRRNMGGEKVSRQQQNGILFGPAGQLCRDPHQGRGRPFTGNPLHPGPLEHIYPLNRNQPKTVRQIARISAHGEQANGVRWCGSCSQAVPDPAQRKHLSPNLPINSAYMISARLYNPFFY